MDIAPAEEYELSTEQLLLESIPLEVWEMITGHISDKDLFRMGVLNTYFNELFSSPIFYTR